MSHRPSADAAEEVGALHRPSAEEVRAFVSQKVTAMEGFADQVLIDMVCRRVAADGSAAVDRGRGFDPRLLESDLRLLMNGRATELAAALSDFVSAARKADLGPTESPEPGCASTSRATDTDRRPTPGSGATQDGREILSGTPADVGGEVALVGANAA